MEIYKIADELREAEKAMEENIQKYLEGLKKKEELELHKYKQAHVIKLENINKELREKYDRMLSKTKKKVEAELKRKKRASLKKARESLEEMLKELG